MMTGLEKLADGCAGRRSPHSTPVLRTKDMRTVTGGPTTRSWLSGHDSRSLPVERRASVAGRPNKQHKKANRQEPEDHRVAGP